MKKMHLLAVAVAAMASTLAVAQTTAPAGARAGMRIDANGDGSIDRAEAARMPRLAAKFDQLDTNKDGKLSAAERPGRAHGRHDGKRGGRLQALDTDKDGRISRTEAAGAKAGFVQRFDGLDANRDGYLDRADMQLRMARERAAFFTGADADKDGRLSRDEFVVERGARAADRRERFAKRAQAAGKQAGTRAAPSEAEQLQRAGVAFERMDANKDGAVSRAEFDAAKPARGGKGRHGRGR